MKNQTLIDSNEALGLKHNITFLYELNELESINILKAKTWVKTSRAIKSNFPSESSLRLLHKKMFEDVWQWAGQYRSSEKNIGRYQAAQVPEAVINLCNDLKYRINLGKEDLEYLAVIFHHRLTDIHPFPNGNGRFAREATNILLNANNSKEFTWGIGIKSIEEARKTYISALKSADQGSYGELLHFVRT